MTEDGPLTHSALSHIRGFYPSLSPSERKVADFILANHQKVMQMTLAELAAHSDVSDATVVRFCRALGFQSYLELKIALMRSLLDSPDLIFDHIQKDDSPLTIMRKVFLGSIQAMQDTLDLLSDEALERAVTLLQNARSILIVGVGTSSPMAHELHNRLSRLHLNCKVETDAYLQLMQAALLDENDVLVVISQTGASQPPINTTREAHRHGCKIIAITGNPSSELSKLADVVLLSVSHESRPETLASRVAQHALIQGLYVLTAMRMSQVANQNEYLIWDAIMRASNPKQQ
ncbi:MurR/RpiR family transcriptional regulator [uncultured Thermanaerothrix sp.]|uniref:MurR/RpiR family transcriptional regulator n=1 Tax=uncultured Thermanaerothrix sp. TaxID=1195149 RepID=UPI00262CA5C3|nr:MurR/RpiR family transcriptional regulator [uncultured Thermanaerothrix sp.]